MRSSLRVKLSAKLSFSEFRLVSAQLGVANYFACSIFDSQQETPQ
jgi:hypothetical protein